MLPVPWPQGAFAVLGGQQTVCGLLFEKACRWRDHGLPLWRGKGGYLALLTGRTDSGMIGEQLLASMGKDLVLKACLEWKFWLGKSCGGLVWPGFLKETRKDSFLVECPPSFAYSPGLTVLVEVTELWLISCTALIKKPLLQFMDQTAKLSSQKFLTFHSIIPGNEIPDSEMSVEKYCYVSLHTTVLNLLISLFASVPRLCWFHKLPCVWSVISGSTAHCLAIFEKVCVEQTDFQSDQQFSASTGQLS